MSSPSAFRILLITNNGVLANSLFREFNEQDAALSLIREMNWKVCVDADVLGVSAVLIDLDAAGSEGMNMLQELHMKRPLRPVLVMSERASMDTVVRCSRWGAYDFIRLDEPDATIVKTVLAAARVYRSTPKWKKNEAGPQNADGLVGDSEPMMRLYREIGALAARDVTTLIRGSTGSGKELVARTLHSYSKRSMKPLVAVNCAAIPETLLESELFGHERGAFTGAVRSRIGRFEEAEGGVLFLDEIGEMAPSTQAKLLRVLQDRQIRRLGGSDLIPINVRIIAATNVNIEQMIAEGLFREDLYYRLSATVLCVPDLNERQEDIPALVDHFAELFRAEYGYRQCVFEPDAIDELCQHHWRGNVRELQNVVHKCLISSRGYGVNRGIVATSLQGSFTKPAPKEKPDKTRPNNTPSEFTELFVQHEGQVYQQYHNRMDRILLEELLKHANGNLSKMAATLGISRTTLRMKMSLCQLSHSRYKKSS